MSRTAMCEDVSVSTSEQVHLQCLEQITLNLD